MHITSPALLNSAHDVANFDCGDIGLNHWLKTRALQNQQSAFSRTFVVTDEKQQVLGYYCLSAGSIARKDSIKKLTRNSPDILSVAVLGRLAVSKSSQHLGIGKGLLKDAISRTLNIANELGICALLVHALNDEAKRFYLKYGFEQSPNHPYTLMLSLKLK